MTRLKVQHPTGGRVSSVAIALLVHCSWLTRGQAENRISIKHEQYQEDNDRVRVQTTAALFDVSLTPTIVARGKVVLDSISGATPTGGAAIDTGGAPLPVDQVPLKRLHDRRRAVNVELGKRWGLWTVTPQISYSKESDYESKGVALNQTFDFNQKNTTLLLGLAHDFDEVLDSVLSFKRQTRHKDSTDAIIGLTQVLSPTTVLTVNFTYGYSEGYLNDPYKVFNFTYSVSATQEYPEQRPQHKSKEVGYVSLQQFVEPLNAGAELSYRITHDSFGIWSHTAELTWAQKIGKHVVLEPSIRYYRQSAANFYYVSFAGDPTTPEIEDLFPTPKIFSADYRLSQLHAWTYGIKAVVKLGENLSVDLGYKRYVMSGEDGATSASAYPSAHVFSAGASLNF